MGYLPVEERSWAKDGKLFRLQVFYDEDAENPRKVFDPVTRICTARSRHSVGDETFEDATEFLEELARVEVAHADVVAFVESGEARCPLSISKDGAEWVLSSAWDGEVARSETKERLAEYALEEMGNADLRRLLEKSGVHLRDLYQMVHSGTSVSLSDYGDPWDSGRAGFVVMKKSDVVKLGAEGLMFEDEGKGLVRVGEDNWLQAAEAFAKIEVEELDCYLKGEVYRAVLSQADTTDDPSDADFYETDSLCGIVTSRAGEDLVDLCLELLGA